MNLLIFECFINYCKNYKFFNVQFLKLLCIKIQQHKSTWLFVNIWIYILAIFKKHSSRSQPILVRSRLFYKYIHTYNWLYTFHFRKGIETIITWEVLLHIFKLKYRFILLPKLRSRASFQKCCTCLVLKNYVFLLTLVLQIYEDKKVIFLFLYFSTIQCTFNVIDYFLDQSFHICHTSSICNLWNLSNLA